MTFRLHRLHPLFVAEVVGVQICDPVQAAEFAQIRAAFEEYSVLVFRDQRLDDAGHIAFSRLFGPLESTVKGNPAAGSQFARQSNLDMATGEVIPPEDKRLSYLKAARLWHTDSSFKLVPSLCSLLAAYIVPPEGGNTEFAACRAAYDELPIALKERIEGLAAIHSQMHTLALIDPTVITDEMRNELDPVEQPLVRVNPVNGRKAIYAGAHAYRVRSLSDLEGAALLRQLNEHATQSRYVYSHAWRVGDLVVWDNRAVFHRATPYDSAKYKRLLQRTTVAGNEAEYRLEREHRGRRVVAPT